MSGECILVGLVVFMIAALVGVYVGTDRPHDTKG